MLTDQEVTQIFRAIARREPAKAELDRYTGLETPEAALAAIMADESAGTARVTTFYQIFYNRLPDGAGLDFWTGVVAGNPGFGNPQLAGAFFGAGEFETLYGGRPVEEAVRAIYENVLGREADAEGLAFWTGAVLDPGNGFGLRELGLAFALSDETGATFAPLIADYLSALARDAAIPVGLFDYAESGDGEKPGTDTDFEGGDGKVETSEAVALSKGAALPAIGTANAQSSGLIDLDGLRADARFADADGAGLAVAVIDTGIDLDHPAFGPVRGGVSDRILRAIDFTGEGDGTANDVDGHGSNVASIIASEQPNYLGVAPEAGIAALQALDNSGSGSIGDIEQALRWVVDNAVALDIVAVNMSLGGFSNLNAAEPYPFGWADEFAALEALGVTVVVAAGNDYFSFQSPGASQLSADPRTISVGAVWDEARSNVFWGDGAKDFTTAPDQITSFSQRATAPAIDTLFAPGAFIVGAAPGGGTSSLGGTSQAAPQVAGLVVLAQDIAETSLGRRLTVDEVREVLRAGAAQITDAETSADNVRNSGATFDRVDALAIAEAVLALGGPGGGDGGGGDGTPPPGGAIDRVPGNPATDAVFVPGQRTDGIVETPRDTDWYRVRLEEGATYEFSLAGGPSGAGTLADPLLTLVEETGRVLASNDDGGTGRDALLSFTAPATGDFFLVARAYGTETGSYRLTGVRLSGGDDVPAGPSTGSTLAPGVPVTGEIGSLGDRDWHALEVVDGTRYEITLTGAEGGGGTLADPALRIVTAEGVLLVENDNAGGSLDARLVATASGSGTVFVDAGASADGGTGSYTLAVEEIATGGDIAGGTGTGRTLATGGTLESDLGFLGDEDWVRVELSAGQRYDFDLRGAPSGVGTLTDPLLRLHDAAGVEVAVDDDGGEGLEARLVFLPQADGIFYLNAGSYQGEGLGTYALSMSEDGPAPGGDVADDTGTTAAIAPGEAIAGDLEVAGDADWFRAELEAGVAYTFTLTGEGSGAGTLSDPLLRLHDAAGAEITFDDDGGAGRLESELAFTPSAGGTYYVSAESYQRLYAGTYELAMTSAGGGGTGGQDTVPGSPATAARIEPGGAVEGALDFAGDADWYRVSLVSGVDYAIELFGAPSGAGTLADPVLGLHDADGVLIASDDDGGTGFESRLDFRAPRTGEFFVAASGFAGADTGSYRLEVSGRGSGDTVPGGAGTGRVAASGDEIAGRVDFDGDADWYAVDLEAGRLYRATLDGAGDDPLADPLLALLDADGVLIGLDNNSGPGLDSSLVFEAEAAGRLFLSAQGVGSATGGYRLGFEEVGGGVADGVPGDATTPLSIDRGEVVDSLVDAPGDTDWVAVDLVDGVEYLFTLRGVSGGGGTLPDPVLELYAADGTLLAADDDGGPGLDAALSFIAEGSGRAYVSAGGFAGATGTYMLGLAYAEEDGFLARTAPGEEFFGLIDVPGDVDWIATELVGGERYDVALAGAASGVGTLIDPLLGVRNAYGELIASDDDSFGGLESFVSFVAPEDGTYYLEARAFADDEADASYLLLIV